MLHLVPVILVLFCKWLLRKKNGYDKRTCLIVETPISKVQRSGIGKLNNPAKRRV